jgi:hypothetical protein
MSELPNNLNVGNGAQPAPVEIAKVAAPDLDFAKVFKRLRAIRAQIAGFAQDFPVPGFADVIKYIDAIEKEDLKASREAPAP